jgi:transketolase
MKKPEEVLAKHGYPMPGDDLDLNLVKAMEEYKNQFIDFDGPIAMIDHYSRLARNWEDAHARLEEKLRMQYDAEFEAFKVSFEQRTRNDFEQQLNELDKRDESIKNLLRINETLNTVIKKISTGQIHDPSVYNDGLRANEIDLNSGQNVSFREEPRNSGWSV